MDDFKTMKEITDPMFEEVKRIIDIDVFGKYNLRFNRTPSGYMCIVDEGMLKDLQKILDEKK